MSHALEHIGDLRTTAVDHHDPDAHQIQQDDIAHHCLAQLRRDHGVSAVFDHNGLSCKFLNIRQGLYQSPCLLFMRCHETLHFLFPVSRRAGYQVR